MIRIQSWNDDLQETEPVAIEMHTKVKLGCDGEPVTTIEEWMSLSEIETLEQMANYIDGLDYNVQVVD